MSERAGGTKEKGEGKKPHKNKPTSKKWVMYKVSGSALTKKRACPRCGAGIFLAEHKERLYCGKCHYTEFTAKK